jgi:S-DNA-T family DNA segregation ATPase FtsK/SpoIIIE
MNDELTSKLSEQSFYPLQDALDSNEYKNAEGVLLFPVGRDNAGKYVIADLHKLPHIMAGGQTGSGKSNFTEGVLILSLLQRYAADDLKLVLIDPKCVQFTQYNGIPHLQRPVITTPEDAKDAMDWLLNEMEVRFTTLVDSKTMDIEEYNSSDKGHMPFIVLIIDEVADLMMVDGEYYQTSFIKLLQKSAAVGIHIYIGTSRPSEDVLPSLLRANFVTKIAFKTASSNDSEALIDVVGAEQLLGKGDLLFSSLDSQMPLHLQAPYVSDSEQSKVVDSIKDQSK